MIAEWWSRVSTTVIHGTQITAMGMLLVFLTLGLIIVAMLLLTKLPGLRPRVEHKVTESVPAVPAEVVKAVPSAQAKTASTVDDELAQVAAIAAALSQQERALGRRSFARSRVRSVAKWKLAGRTHQLGLSTFD